MADISSKSLTLAQVRHKLKTLLTPKYGDREASAMARLILMSLKGWSQTELLANEDRQATDFIVNRSDEILQQLLQDIPIQYALGSTRFYGLELAVRPGVLIPRPETEELVDIIVKGNPQADLTVLDICTGSGAIALALARNLPFSKIEAIDISPEAIEVAEENATKLHATIKITRGDIFALNIPSESFDIIVSNPPYVAESEKKGMEPNVLRYEPHIALFVPDDDPLRFYRKICQLAKTALKPGGRLYFEINPLFADDLRKLIASFGFRDIHILRDVHGKNRFASSIK